MGLGIRYEAVMRWVGEATRVMATGKTFVKMRHDPNSGSLRAVRIPEHLDVIADMACGAQAHFGLSKVWGLRPEDEMVLFGNAGILRIAGDKLYGGQRGDTALQKITIPPEEQGGWRVEEEIVNAIRGIEPIAHTTFDDGVKYMAFTEAVVRSMAEGRPIPLP
jgi:predicted dehydrogenase